MFPAPFKQLVLAAAVFSGFGMSLPAATTFSENFDSIAITSALTAQSGWMFGSDSTIVGTAQNRSGTRTYITTTDTDYNTVDFTAQVKVTVNGGGGDGLAFVGFGTGIPDGEFYDEPADSFYVRIAPNDFGPFIDGNISPTRQNDVLAEPSVGNGTYLVQIQKIGDSITFGVQQNYVSGEFVASPGLTLTKSLSSDLAFLNSTNATLFFGTQVGNATFDDFTVMAISAAPEPSKVLFAVVGGAFILLRRRRAVRA